MNHTLPASVGFALATLSTIACTKGVAPAGTGGSTSTGAASVSSSSTSAGTSSSTGTGGVPSVGAPFFGEGTRLKANYYDFGGGAVQFLGWFDTMLGAGCQFQRTASGVACIPVASDASTYYEDAQCSKRLVSYAGDCAPPQYASRQDSSSDCSDPGFLGTGSAVGTLSMYPVGAGFTGTVYTKNGAGCVTTTATNTKFASLAPELPIAATFVMATSEKQPRGPILKEQVLHGSDGSWQIYRPFSGESACNPRTVNGTEQCMPVFNGFVNSTLFADSACTMSFIGSVGFVRQNLCAPPQYIQDYSLDGQGCPTYKIYDVGAAVTLPPLYYQGAPGTCPTYVTSNFNSVSLGPPIPDLAARFGSVNQETIGTGRVQAHYFGSGPNGPLANPREFIDTSSMATCSPTAFSDKVLRCVPSDVPLDYGGFFSDSACVNEDVVLYSPPHCGATPPPPTRAVKVITPPGCAAGSATKLFSLTAYASAVYQGQNGTCVSYPAQSGSQTFKLGTTPLDLGGFATGQWVQH